MGKLISFVSVLFLALATVWLVYTPKENSKASEKMGDVEISPRENIEARIETYSFEESVNRSDLIAEVAIVSKIKEIDEPSPKTIFEANVVNKLKGDTNQETIKVLQEGTSEWSFNGQEQFAEKEEYIIFLKKATGKDYDGTNTYWILGAETNTYKIIQDNRVKKIAKHEVELEAIEDKTLSTTNQGLQVLDKEKFQNKIADLLEEK